MTEHAVTTDSVLLIDDDVKLCEMLRSYLGSHSWQVEAAHTGNDGIRLATEQDPDLIVLDVMLPDMDGFEVLRALHRKKPYKVLMLTARGQEVDRIVGLEMGADDYLGKPFNPRELVARMKAILRRSQKAEPASQAVGAFQVDSDRRQIAYHAKVIPLSDVEFILLERFLADGHAILTRDDLSITLFERRARPFERTVDMHVSRLRKKLESLPGFSGGIRAIRNSGYMFFMEKEFNG
ncbi:MAG: response regulator transcription factor [Acidobacteriaceae bacterium]|nr:response regulator transcription factor [Acidobacteriaceae bacterium]